MRHAWGLTPAGELQSAVPATGVGPTPQAATLVTIYVGVAAVTREGGAFWTKDEVLKLMGDAWRILQSRRTNVDAIDESQPHQARVFSWLGPTSDGNKS